MKRIIIGTIAVIFLAYGLATGEFWQELPSGSAPNLMIEKVLASEEDPDSGALDKNPAQEKTIFSWSTIISLNLVIIGIIAFRRNTYS